MSSFLDALKQAAPKPTFDQTPKKTQSPALTKGDEPPLSLTVNRVLDRKRIDLSFSAKPPESILSLLRTAGWNWNGNSQCWYHFDGAVNRDFLIEKFGVDATLMLLSVPAELPVTSVSKTSEVKTPEQPSPVPPPPFPSKDLSPDFLEYKNQVDALMQKLNMTAADLMVYAINHLYRCTIEN